MMEERLLPIRPCFPTHHACRCDRHPIDTAGLIWKIASDLLKALAAEDLALPGDMVQPFETVGFRAVARLLENRPCNPKGRVISKLSQEEFKVIRIQRNVGVQVTNDFVCNALDPLLAGIEGVYLGCEVPLFSHGTIHQFYPWMISQISARNTPGVVG